MALDYGKLNQGEVLITATMPGGIFLLEQIKTALGAWNIASDLSDVLFS